MAKYEELFRMRADVDDADVIEQFFTEHGVDFTIRLNGSGSHDYGILNGTRSGTGIVEVCDTEILPYDAESDVLPIKLTMTDGSTKLININPAEYEQLIDINHQKDNLSTEVSNATNPPTATEDMEPYDFNTSLINDFIQFLLPYNVDAKAQGVILDIFGKTLEFCGDIRNGKSDISDNTTYSIEFNKDQSKNVK